MTTKTTRKPVKTAAKPKYQTAGNTFYAQTSLGEIKIPLAMKTKVFFDLQELDETAAFVSVLENLGDSRTMDTIGELDFFETAPLIEAFFRAFGDKIESSLGKL